MISKAKHRSFQAGEGPSTFRTFLCPRMFSSVLKGCTRFFFFLERHFCGGEDLAFRPRTSTVFLVQLFFVRCGFWLPFLTTESLRQHVERKYLTATLQMHFSLHGVSPSVKHGGVLPRA